MGKAHRMAMQHLPTTSASDGADAHHSHCHGDILSVRMRNRATMLRMLASNEYVTRARDLRKQLRIIAAQEECEAERVQFLEAKVGHSA
jgi:hypothetical protein